MKQTLIITLLFSITLGLFATEGEKKLIQHGQTLERARKTAEAKAFYMEQCQKENLSPATRKLFLNRAVMFCSGKERSLALNFLSQAALCDGGATENYRTNLLLGNILSRSEPEKALSSFLCMDQKNKIHPALIFQGYFGAGQIYERQEDFQKAHDYYNQAMTAAKMIKYKFNASAAENGIARTKEKINNTKK